MKKSIVSIFFLLLFYPFVCFSQSQVDTLINQLSVAVPGEKPAVLNKLAWELRNSMPEKSIEYGLQSVEMGLANRDFHRVAEAYSFIGVAFRILGNYSEALDYFYKGLELAKLHQIKEQEGYAYINIANLLIYQEFYNGALENLAKALEIAKEINNPQMLAYVYLNTGRSLLLKKEFEKALEKLYLSLKIRKDLNQPGQQAVSYKYIGDTYFEIQNPDEALTNYELALKTVDYMSDKDLVANLYIKIAEIYFQRNNLIKAKENAEKSLEIAREIGARLIIRDSFRVLSRVNKLKGNYKEASSMLTCIIAYNDTLFNQTLSEKIFNLEYKYIKEIKEAEIDLLNKDIQINELMLTRTKLTSLTLVIIIILITGILIYYLQASKVRKKQNKMLEKQKEQLNLANLTKDKMFLIISHDLRGPVASLIPLLDLLLIEEDIKHNEKLVHIFNSFRKSVQQLSDLLENLLFWARNQDGELSLLKERINLNHIIEKTLLLYKGIAGQKNVSLGFSADREYFVMADKNMAMLIIRNLISNAIKYTPMEGLVNVQIVNQNDYVQVSFSDSGVGFDEKAAEAIFDTHNFYTTIGTANEIGSGIGLILCKEFIERNGGKIWAESKKGKGSSFFITLPTGR